MRDVHDLDLLAELDDTEPIDTAGHDRLRAAEAEAAVWRRLVAGYRDALAVLDQLAAPAPAVRALAARSAVDAARLALFIHLDHTGKEATR